MATVNEKVLAMVRQEIENDPKVTNKALLTKARRIARSVGKLSPRQFHARYRLRATREMAAAERPVKRSRKPTATPVRKKVAATASNREAIRAVLLELATEVAVADDKAAVIHVIGSIDRYVDRVVEAC